MASATLLAEAVARVEKLRPEVVLVDLRDVTFLDCAGYHALDDTARRLEPARAWCGFADSEAEWVRRVLDLCDLERRLRRWPTIAEALRAAHARDGAASQAAQRVRS